MRNTPERVWTAAVSRPIDGMLPPALRDTLRRTLDGILTRVPAASVAVAIPGEGLWAETRGRARTQPPEQAEENTLFQVASITKTFTAAAVLQLVEEGRLHLGDAVDRWFPGVPHAKVMTVEHLLRHTSGLVSFNTLPSLGALYRTPADVISLAAAKPLQFCPGTSWAYSNTGYVMLGS